MRFGNINVPCFLHRCPQKKFLGSLSQFINVQC